MSRTTYEIANGSLLRHYTTEDGVQGIHQIPLGALAVRMELLGLDDPGTALSVVLAEMGLTEEENPYLPVYAAISAREDPAPARAEAIDALPVEAGPDTREESELKEFLRGDDMVEAFHGVRERFRKDITPLEGGGE